jgi:Fibronectin type-III domain
LRTATSVGSQSETYTFSYTGLAGISVTPSASSFTAAPGSETAWNVTFLRTTAPLSAYQTGFIVWTGNKGHVVRMPVVIQPVKFQAPLEVTGSGATGSVTYNAKAGYNGNLAYSISGLQAATKFDNVVNGDPACAFNAANPDANVAAGNATLNTFTTPSGASYIRFQTFQNDPNTNANTHDLDVFVYRAPPGSSTYTLVLTSGGPDANDTNSTSAGSLTAGAQFKVYVHGCGVGPGQGSFTLFAWALTGSPSNPFTTFPSGQAVTIGQSIPTMFGLTGLPTGNRYLGRALTIDPSPPASTMAATTIAVMTR